MTDTIKSRAWNAMVRRQKRAAKQLDDQIDAIYRRHFSDGTQISLTDIPKVFAAGREAAHAGEDVEVAVVNFVNSIKVGAR